MFDYLVTLLLTSESDHNLPSQGFFPSDQPTDLQQQVLRNQLYMIYYVFQLINL